MKIDDFTGFYWNGHHTSEWNIKVVSSSDRYDSRFLSEISNSLTDIPGGDGQYYHNSTFGPKKWTCNIAFDKITEINKREIENWLSSKELSDFIFDEVPFKAYTCKLESQPSITWLCFDEPKTTKNRKEPRIYKGEGTLNFIAPFPYAHNARKINENGTTGEPLKYLSDIEFLKNHSKFKKYIYLLSKSGSAIHLHNSRSVLDLAEIRGSTTQLFEVNEQGFSFGKNYDFISGYFGKAAGEEVEGCLKVELNSNSSNNDDVNNLDYSYVNETSLSDNKAYLIFGLDGDSTTLDRIDDYYDKIIYNSDFDNGDNEEKGAYELKKGTKRLQIPLAAESSLNKNIYFGLPKNGVIEKTQFQIWEELSKISESGLDNLELSCSLDQDLDQDLVISNGINFRSNYYQHREIEYNPVTMKYKEYNAGDFVSKFTDGTEDSKSKIELYFKGNIFSNENIKATLVEQTDNSNFFSFLKNYIESSPKIGKDEINGNNNFAVFEKFNNGSPLVLSQLNDNEYDFYCINSNCLNNILNTFDDTELRDNILAAASVQLLVPCKENYQSFKLTIKSNDKDDDDSPLWSFKLRKDVIGNITWQDQNGNNLELFSTSTQDNNISSAELSSEIIFKEYETLYENIDEWSRASGLKENSLVTSTSDCWGQSVNYDIPCGMNDLNDSTYQYYYFPVYNAGDIDSPFKLKIDFMDKTHIDSSNVTSYGKVWDNYQYQVLLRQVNDDLFLNQPNEYGNNIIPTEKQKITNLLDLTKGKKYILSDGTEGYYRKFHINNGKYYIDFLNNDGEDFSVEWANNIYEVLTANSKNNLLGLFTLDFSANDDNNEIKTIISAYAEDTTSDNVYKTYRTSIEIDSKKQSINWIIEKTDVNGDVIKNEPVLIYPANFMLTNGEIFSIPPKLDNLQVVIYTGVNGKIIDGDRNRTTISYPYLYY